MDLLLEKDTLIQISWIPKSTKGILSKSLAVPFVNFQIYVFFFKENNLIHFFNSDLFHTNNDSLFIKNILKHNNLISFSLKIDSNLFDSVIISLNDNKKHNFSTIKNIDINIHSNNYNYNYSFSDLSNKDSFYPLLISKKINNFYISNIYAYSHGLSSKSFIFNALNIKKLESPARFELAPY